VIRNSPPVLSLAAEDVGAMLKLIYALYVKEQRDFLRPGER
jgi:hypothetical protein